jgi:DNA-binding GntR family transcriptional regulator
LTKARISEIFEIRAVLEGYLLERAAPEFDADELSGLEEMARSMYTARGRDQWLERNAAFHRRLLAPADAPMAMAIIERLSHQVERYLRRQKGGVVRSEQATQEHVTVIEALQRGAVKQASKALTQHVLATRDAVVAALPDDPS